MTVDKILLFVFTPGGPLLFLSEISNKIVILSCFILVFTIIRLVKTIIIRLVKTIIISESQDFVI